MSGKKQIIDKELKQNKYAPKRKLFERKADLAWIAEWYLKGKTQQWMSDNLAVLRDYRYEISRSMISRDLKAIAKLWEKSALVDFNKVKQREMRKLDLMEYELWEAWESSKGQRVIIEDEYGKAAEGDFSITKDKRITKKVGDDGQVVTLSQTIDKNVSYKGPDVRYMNAILDIVKTRLEVHGMFAPEQHLHAVVSPEELEALANKRWKDLVDPLKQLEDMNFIEAPEIEEGEIIDAD